MAQGWLDWPLTPRTAFIPPTPPGPEGSKGTRALTGVRGVLPITGEDELMAAAASEREGATRVSGASLALYRKYRPATFAEVKGQEQVTARVRQDVQRPDPGPVAELRERAHPRPLRGLRFLRRPGPVRAGQHRRDRDRRRLARRRRRRPGTARAGLLHPGVRALQDLHH